MADTWRHTEPRVEGGSGLLRELVRYASLAANSHNTQPWLFELGTDRITVRPDYSRRCPAVDPDDHHLFASLGCAVENLVLAAQAHGLNAEVTLPGPSEDAIRVDLESSAARDSLRFLAITERQCTRAPYDGKPVAGAELAKLEAAAREEGVALRMFTDDKAMEEVLEYVVAGNSAQMNDDAFVRELKDWIRFSEAAIVEHRDGLFSASSGNPTLPGWAGSLVLRFAFTEKGENEKYRQQIRSSAGIVAFVSASNDKASWVRVGRSYQRFALESTALGLRHAFVNQAVEVPAVRAQFAQYLGIGDRRPDLLVRFGYGPLMPRSARRPIDQILV
ncbi:MAG: Tat pathway signal protein [Pseudomonadota bacterium]